MAICGGSSALRSRSVFFAKGSDPVEHGDVGDLQNPSDGPEAHAFQIKPERLRPQLGRLSRRGAPGEFAAPVPAAPALSRANEARLMTILRPALRTRHLNPRQHFNWRAEEPLKNQKAND